MHGNRMQIGWSSFQLNLLGLKGFLVSYPVVSLLVLRYCEPLTREQKF